MSVSDILASFGFLRVLGFVLAVLLYLALHVTRVPFVLVARLLALLQQGLDERITTTITRPTESPGGSRA